MKKLNIFLYVCLVRYKAIDLILKKFKNYNFSIILDMEDSAQDLFDYQNNLNLKIIARKGLSYLSNNNFLNKINFYVRINSQISEFYKDDIAIIQKVIKDGSPIKGIFLPKVENYDQIKNCHDNLFIENKKTPLIIPMIETKKGFENLNNILFQDKEYNLVKHVHYGHYDYCLDNCLWPFPEPYHYEYWQIVDKIFKIIDHFGKEYIHTPFPLIKNSNIYWSAIDRMHENFNSKSLNITLVNIDLKYMKDPFKIKKIKLKNISKDLKYKTFFAKKIINEYINNRSTNKSFSLSRKRFIPPHLYMGAKFFLKSIHE